MDEIKLLKPFFENPMKDYSAREFARKLGISPATASKKLKGFVGKKFLKYRKERILDLYKADLDSESYRDIKVYYNIRKIKELLLDDLNEFFLKPTIVMFGSCSSGLDIHNSDIDLLILSHKKKKFDVEKYRKKLNRELQLFVHGKVSDISNKHLLSNMVNGIVIQGDIEWI